jgi:hypothetical protein
MVVGLIVAAVEVESEDKKFGAAELTSGESEVSRADSQTARSSRQTRETRQCRKFYKNL